MADEELSQAPDLAAAAAAERATEQPSAGVSDARLRAFEDVHRGIWGEDAPPGRIEAAARSMTLVEFAATERSKPAYIYSPEYRERQQLLDLSMPGSFERLVG